ncbi:MAG: BACON domain-containing protein, partial [Proteiniphilum sp.]|nr:BACON domain-containing protein [Proteiniphilum sp.]
MKANNCTLSFLLLSILFLSHCGKDEIPGGGNGNGDGDDNKTTTLEVSASPIHFAFEGGMSEITVTTNAKSWNVTSSKSWCRVLSKEASNFTVGAAENKAITPPEQALLTVTAEGTTKKVTIEVTQDAAPKEAYIRPVTDKVIMNYQGGSNGIGIKTNITGWSCRSDQSWCSAEKISDDGINIKIEETWGGVTPRPALVTLYGSEGDSLASIQQIKQSTIEKA